MEKKSDLICCSKSIVSRESNKDNKIKLYYNNILSYKIWNTTHFIYKIYCMKCIWNPDVV